MDVVDCYQHPYIGIELLPAAHWMDVDSMWEQRFMPLLMCGPLSCGHGAAICSPYLGQLWAAHVWGNGCYLQPIAYGAAELLMSCLRAAIELLPQLMPWMWGSTLLPMTWAARSSHWEQRIAAPLCSLQFRLQWEAAFSAAASWGSIRIGALHLFMGVSWETPTVQRNRWARCWPHLFMGVSNWNTNCCCCFVRN